MAETLNMITCSLNRLRKQIRLQLASEDYSPFIVIGKSGVGKTESISDLAKELGIGFKELRLSHYQESDLVGLPYIDNGKTKHAETDLLPDTNDPNQGILLLDEITSSQKSMRSAVYQLMDSSRKLGQYVLPKRWLIVCCGNGPEDGGDFRGIEPALMSRGRCMRVEEDLSAWKNWAINKGVHPIVIAFLSFMPDNLHVIDMDKPNDMIACPRNWVKLSTQLINMEKYNKERNGASIITDEDDLEFAACSCVGSQCGPNFVSFYKYNKAVIDAEDVMEGKVSPESVKNVETEVMYIMVQNLIKCVRQELLMHRTGDYFTSEAVKKIANVCKWLISVGRQYRLDLAIMALQDLCSNVSDFGRLVMAIDGEFDEACPEFLEFCTENSLVVYNNTETRSSDRDLGI